MNRAVIAAYKLYGCRLKRSNSASKEPETNNDNPTSKNGAGTKIQGARLVQGTPLTTKYEVLKAVKRRTNCAKAYPVSNRLAAIASNAPIIPKPTDTDQSPGLPKPRDLNAEENQLSASTNLAAIVAFAAVIHAINKNKIKSSSNGIISRPNRFQLLEIA